MAKPDATTAQIVVPQVTRIQACPRSLALAVAHRDTRWQDQAWSEALWYKGKVTRRRFLGLSAAAGAVGAQMLVPASWRKAFGQARPYKLGTLQSLTGAAAPEGRMSLIGTELAVRRVNASGGIN